jgi:hypothetical protein
VPSPDRRGIEIDPILKQARQQTRRRQGSILKDDPGLGGEGIEQLAPKPLEDPGVTGLIGPIVDVSTPTA